MYIIIKKRNYIIDFFYYNITYILVLATGEVYYFVLLFILFVYGTNNLFKFVSSIYLISNFY